MTPACSLRAMKCIEAEKTVPSDLLAEMWISVPLHKGKCALAVQQHV